MKSLELKWGLLIGAANLLWLYISYYLGMHTNGLAWIQAMTGVSFLITLIGFILAFRELALREPGFTFAEGLKAGVLIAVITALFALVAQAGYFYVVNPEFTDYMVGESRNYAEQRGMTAKEIEAFADSARVSFSFQFYLAQAAVGALLIGAIFSLIILMVRHFRKRR